MDENPWRNPPKLQSSHSVSIMLEKYMSPNIWKRLEKDLPSKSVVAEDIEQLLQPLFDKSPLEMVRFGTARQLAYNLKLFRNFTGAHRVFQNDPCNLFFTVPTTYYNAKKETFIHKQDIFVPLQNAFFQKCPLIMREIDHGLSHAVASAYLKSHEQKLDTFCEMVSLDKIDKFINKKMDDIIVYHLTNTFDRYQNQSSEAPDTAEGFLNALRDVVPGWNDTDYGGAIRIVSEIFGNESLTEKSVYISTIVNEIRSTVELLDLLTQRCLELPLLCLFDADSKVTRYVRLFQDGDKKFVMADELNRVVSVPKEMLSTRYLKTVDEKTALELIQTSEGPVEFVIVPIKRAKHAALPIRTPYKGHCKLAIDLFHELIQDLIFDVNIFQKLKADEWPVMTAFFENLQHHFNHNETEPYFIRLDEYEKDEVMRLNYFKKYDNRPTKHIRDFNTNIFIAEDLEDELVHLGVKNFFDNVTFTTNIVYDSFVEKKNALLLQKSDFHAALAQCLMISSLENIADLRTFVHNQHGCDHVLRICCGVSPTRRKTRYDRTECNSIGLADVRVMNVYDTSSPQTLVCSNGEELMYNLDAHPLTVATHDKNYANSDDAMFEILTEGFDVFIVSRSQIDLVYDETEIFEKIMTQIRTLAAFLKYAPNQKLYLRTISSCVVDREAHRVVFIQEAMQMIMILLGQQGDPVNIDYLTLFMRNWIERHSQSTLIPLEELNVILEYFDIDKTKITLVPDIGYAAWVLHKMPSLAGCPAVTLITQTREKIMSRDQAIFKVFQEIICDVHWEEEVFKGCHPDHSVGDLRALTLRTIRKLWEMEFFPVDDLEHVLRTVKKHDNYQERKKRRMLTPLIKLYDCDMNDSISLSFFLSECENFSCRFANIHPGISKKTLDEALLPVWKARVIFLLKWNTMFFEMQSDEERLFKDIVTQGILHRIPLANCETQTELGPAEQEYVNQFELAQLSVLYPPQYHEWLKDTSWRDRTYITRLPKWELYEKTKNQKMTLKMIQKETARISKESVDKYWENWKNTSQVMMNILRMEQEFISSETDQITHENSEKGEESTENQKNEEEKEGEKLKNPSSSVQEDERVGSSDGSQEMVEPEREEVTDYKATLEAHREDMDQIRQMIKGLEVEVRGKKTSEQGTSTAAPKKSVSKKGGPALERPECCKASQEAHQKEKNEMNEEIKRLNQKCQRTSDLCNKRTEELETTKRELEKAKKKESAAEKKLKDLKGKPTREELEKELEQLRQWKKTAEEEKMKEQEEFKEQMEKVEKEKVEQAKVQEQLVETIRTMNQEYESQRLTSSSEVEQLNMRVAELESFYSESQQRIRLLKDQLPNEVVESFNFRPSLEMRKTLGKLRTDQDTLLSGKHSDIALKKVLRLEKMTDDPKVHDLANYYMTDYNTKLSEFSDMVSENIRRIQANSLLTQAELLPHLEFPKLNDYIDNETTKAQQAINEKIERECMCCMTEEEQEGGWWRCSGCLKKSHLVCLEQAVDHSGLNICPHCRCAIVE